MKTFIIQSEKLFEGRLIATQLRKDLKVLVYLNGVVVGKYIKNRVTFAIHTKKSHGKCLHNVMIVILKYPIRTNLRGHLAMKHGVFEDNNVKCFCYLVEAKTVCTNWFCEDN